MKLNFCRPQSLTKLFKFELFIVPLSGNFTEEEANGIISPQDNSLEYPLQRDEVQSTPNKGERNHHVPQSRLSRRPEIGNRRYLINKDNLSFRPQLSHRNQLIRSRNSRSSESS